MKVNDMTQLFNRDGSEFNGTPEFNDSGKPIRLVPVVCDRCHVINGERVWLMGIENGRPFSRTGFQCWTCGNTGVRGQRKERLYTAVELARVNKAAATREANRQEAFRAAHEKAEAERLAREHAFYTAHVEFISKLNTLEGEFWDNFRKSFYDRMAAPTERQTAMVEEEVAKRAANASSEFFGAVGDKVTITITVEKVITLSSPFYGTSWITIARTEQGNVVTYKGTADIGRKGETLTIKATVKGHEMYNNVRQTLIQRPKVLEAA
jgi:hypothetical protein